MATEKDVIELLKRYECPWPLAVVRMRIWGAINSPAERVSPTEEFDALWRGKRLQFTSDDEVQKFYDVLIWFWNAIAEHRKNGKPVNLPPQTGVGTHSGLKRAMIERNEQIDGFASGFIANLQLHAPLGLAIDRYIDKLSDVTDEIDKLIEVPIGPGNISKVRSKFLALGKRAQKLINQLSMQSRLNALGDLKLNQSL